MHNMYDLFLTEVRTIIKSKYEEIDNKVTILLGQRLDYRKRGLFSSKNYDVRYSFSGRFSDLRIWRGEISDEQIQSLSRCEDVVLRGVVLDWDIGKYNGNEVSVLEYENTELCKTYPLKNLAIFNHGRLCPAVLVKISKDFFFFFHGTFLESSFKAN